MSALKYILKIIIWLLKSEFITTLYFSQGSGNVDQNPCVLHQHRNDPLESVNLAADPSYSPVLEKLRQSLQKWQWQTGDPWVCGPDYVLEDKLQPRCRPLYNGL